MIDMVADTRMADAASDLLGIARGGTTPWGVGARLLHATLKASYGLAPGWAGAPRLVARPLEALWPAPIRAPYIHVYDCNSAYLSAARNSMFPCGQVTPGAWDDASAGSVLDLSHIDPRSGDPLLLPTNGAGWYSRDVFNLLTAQGGRAALGPAAYNWPECRRILRPWADAIWTARMAARDRHDPALADYIKRVAVVTIGYLGHMPTEGQPARWWYQPQWRAVIIAQHAAKMARLVLRWREAGAMVLGLNDDAIAIGSGESDAGLACPDPTQLGAGLGRLKVSVTLGAPYSGKYFTYMAAAPSPQRWFKAILGAGHGTE